jgi:uncharacterized membrane protein HdeD (DUF308 family)
MKNEIKKNLNFMTFISIIMDVLFIVLGIFLVANPEMSTKVSGILIGLILMISGTYEIIQYVMNIDATFIFTFKLVYGILSIIAGFLIISDPFSVANFLTIMVGIWLLVSAGLKVSIAMQLKYFKEETWLFDLVVALLTIVLGILLLVNPFNGYIVLSTYAGIMLVIYAGMDIIEQFLFRKRASEIEKIIF